MLIQRDDFQQRILHLEGAAHDVGKQLGQHLGDRLADNISRYLTEFDQADDKFMLDAARLHGEAIRWLRTLPPRFQAEFEGIAQGANLPLQTVAEWFFVEQCAVLRCSSTVSMLNGHAWLARNNDTVAPGMWGYVTVKAIKDAIPTMTFGRQGDVFVPSGINQARLWLHYNFLAPADTLDTTRPHIPPFVFMMQALESCETIADVEAQIQTIQRTDGMLLFVVDGKTDQFAVFECGHGAYFRREPAAGSLIGTNHYSMCEDPDAPLSTVPQTTLGRYNRLEQLLTPIVAQPEIAKLPNVLIEMLGDEQIERRGPTFATAYACVGCPATGELWYTFGGYPAASQGNWQQVPWPW